jgi:hypothetical protein
MADTFMRQDMVSLYDLDIYKKYESIFQVVDDDEVDQGAQENRTCHNGHSKCHKLSCGHFVYSEKQAWPCGMNCDLPHTNKKPFFCLLCVREILDNQQERLSRRWHDVLLPTFVHPSTETACWAEQANSMREVEPAYVDPHGYVLLPRIHCTIAMVRAHELRIESEGKQALTTTLAPIEAKVANVSTIAIEYFEHFLAYHDFLDHADMRILVSIAVILIMRQQLEPLNHQAVLNNFNAPPCANFEELVEIAVRKIDYWASGLVIRDVLPRLPPAVRSDAAAMVAADLASRTWHRSIEGSFGMQHWIGRKRNLAWCIVWAFKWHGLEVEYEDVLEATGEKRDFLQDDFVHSVMSRFVLEKDWRGTGHIRRFVKFGNGPETIKRLGALK